MDTVTPTVPAWARLAVRGRGPAAGGERWFTGETGVRVEGGHSAPARTPAWEPSVLPQESYRADESWSCLSQMPRAHGCYWVLLDKTLGDGGNVRGQNSGSSFHEYVTAFKAAQGPGRNSLRAAGSDHRPVRSENMPMVCFEPRRRITGESQTLPDPPGAVVQPGALWVRQASAQLTNRARVSSIACFPEWPFPETAAGAHDGDYTLSVVAMLPAHCSGCSA